MYRVRSRIGGASSIFRIRESVSRFLTQIVNGRGDKDRTNDKEVDEASRRGKGCNFRGGTAVAMHRLGQPDHDELCKTGERSRGIVLRGSYTSVHLTGALMRERRDG